MNKPIINGIILVNTSGDAHFASVAEFKKWFRAERENGNYDKYHAIIKFSVDMHYDTSDTLPMLNWDLVKDNLSLTLTSDYVAPEDVDPRQFYLKPPLTIGPNTCFEDFGHFRPVRVKPLLAMVRAIYNPVHATS